MGPFYWVAWPVHYSSYKKPILSNGKRILCLLINWKSFINFNNYFQRWRRALETSHSDIHQTYPPPSWRIGESGIPSQLRTLFQPIFTIALFVRVSVTWAPAAIGPGRPTMRIPGVLGMRDMMVMVLMVVVVTGCWRWGRTGAGGTVIFRQQRWN